MRSVEEALERRVRERAAHRCEYCLVPASISRFTFPVDHVIARQHRGGSTFGNLALSCPHCNHHKGPNVAGIDPVSGALTGLFNPRRHRWARHFGWDGPRIVGRTPIGRTTIYVLDMNHPDRVELRRLLIVAGVLPGE